MASDPARRLLDRLRLRLTTCDLDLLLFFVRHPQSLLSSAHIATSLGYGLKQVEDALDVLIGARLLTRSLKPKHAARMYVFAVSGAHGEWLPALVEMASSRTGRLALRKALADAARDDPQNLDPTQKAR